MDTIASTGFGLDTDCLNQPDNEFSQNAKAFTNPNVAVLIVTLMFPFLGKMMESVGFKFLPQRAAGFFEKVVDAALQERRESENAGKMHDFLDLMINAEEDTEGEASETDKGSGRLSRSEILVSVEVLSSRSLSHCLSTLHLSFSLSLSVSLSLCLSPPPPLPLSLSDNQSQEQ